MQLDKVSKWLIWVAIILVALSFASPYILTRWSIIDFSNTGQIGDTIGGIMNPFIGIAGVAAMFAAFYMQFKANKLVVKQFERERFENQFFELLKIHRTNSSIMIKSFYEEDKNSKQLIGAKKEIEPMGFENLVKQIHQEYDSWMKNNKTADKKAVFIKTYSSLWRDDFGHYFRHLYLLVKFVISKQFLTYEEQRDYLRILRASLSTYEQIFLYYNWLADYATEWENDTNRFFTDFRMIHNINPNLLIKEFTFDKVPPFNELLNTGQYKKEKGRTNDALFEFENWR